MKPFVPKVLAIAFLSVGFASLAFSQQAAPKDVLPPTPQKPPVSPALSVATPASVSQPSVKPTTVAPQAPAPPQQSKPEVPQAATVDTNKVPASSSGQPLSSGSTPPSPWNRTNTVQSSIWDKTSTAAKPAVDPWSSPPTNARAWDPTFPLNSSGSKTEWK